MKYLKALFMIEILSWGIVAVTVNSPFFNTNNNLNMKKLLLTLLLLVTLGVQAQVYTVTVYNAVKEQCNGDHLMTADGSVIDPQKVEDGTIKWCAVSRDMLRDGFRYGDKIKIYSPDPLIEGIYEIHDTMSPKLTRRIDILMPRHINKGKWKVRIKKK